jgi:hypothetical protein
LLKTTLLIAGILLALFSSMQRDDYVDRLVDLAGTPYAQLNCSAYICAAERHAPCSALSMYWGCDGALDIVAEYSDHTLIDQSLLQPGDVAAIKGIHVVAYVGGGVWMDSDVKHGGVNPINLWMEPMDDPWFSGRVRILRWKQSSQPRLAEFAAEHAPSFLRSGFCAPRFNELLARLCLHMAS